LVNHGHQTLPLGNLVDNALSTAKTANRFTSKTMKTKVGAFSAILIKGPGIPIDKMDKVLSNLTLALTPDHSGHPRRQWI